MAVIIGSEFDETLIGTNDDDIIDGLGGADLILGLGGVDIINGGEGDDVLRGDGGAFYTGPSGNDTLNGGEGDDYMNGGAGVDAYDGGSGFDRVSFYSAAATQGAMASLITQLVSNDGFGNTETMTSVEGLGSGTAYADWFEGDDNANLMLAGIGDTILANGGDDTFQLEGALLLLDGGDGIDTITQFVQQDFGTLFVDSDGDGLAELVVAAQGVIVSLAANAIFDDGYGNSGTILNIENVGGSLLADTLIGDNNANVLSGFGGDDVLNGGNGVDTIFGGDGDDLINMQPTGNVDTGIGETAFGEGGDDLIRNTSGNDLIDGGDGVDRVSYFNIGAAVTVDLNLQGAAQNTGGGGLDTLVSIENVSGTAFADTLIGDETANQLNANNGNDVIQGRGGDDVLIGDADALGNDTLDGGTGNDTVSYSPNLFETGRTEGVFVHLLAGFAGSINGGETDTLIGIENVEGTDFDDQIIGDNGDNTLSGLGGADFINGGNGVDTIFGGDGDDLINMQPTGNVDTGIGETAFGEGGDDLIRNTSGDDLIDGGEGVDRVSYFNIGAAVTVDLNLQGAAQNTGGGGLDTLVSIENVSGTAFDDTLIGDEAANQLNANNGNDVIQGRGGDDVLIGDADAIGNDTLDGGSGVDTVSYSPNLFETGRTEGVFVNLGVGFAGAQSGGETDTLIGIENADGTDFDDFIVGDDNVNVLNGLGGADLVRGLGGGDTLLGGEGDDHLQGDGNPAYNGSSGDDTLFGEGGDDLMRGGAGVDAFDGGDGHDRISFYSLWATQAVVANLITQTISNDGFGNAEAMVSIEGLGAGTVFADHLNGDDNANTLLGDTGDTLIGNGGDDTFFMAGAAALADAGAGVDTVDFTLGLTLVADTDGDGAAEEVLATAGVNVNLLATAVFDDGFGNFGTLIGFENVTGSAFDDIIIGDNNANVLIGGDGADIMQGRGGGDTLIGGGGDDQLRGDGGSVYNGPSGGDTLQGDGGDDTMWGGAGVDTYDGGDGADRVSFYAAAATQGVVASLITQSVSNDGFGNSEIMTSVEGLGSGTAYADHLTGDDNANLMLAGIGDTILANGGDDAFQLEGALMLLDGGAGIDTITRFVQQDFGTFFADSDGDGLAELVVATAGVNVNLLANAIFDDGFGNSGTILNIENVGGSALDDLIFGNHGANALSGFEGNDVLFGFGGDDVLDGGDGDDQLRGDGGSAYNGVSGGDTILGGAGDDIMWGGAGVDTYDGGDGDDRVSFFAFAATQAAVASLLTQSVINDGFGNAETMSSVEGLGGGTAFADHFTGDDNANTIIGDAGDTLIGNGGDDQIQLGGVAGSLDGGAGIDSVNFGSGGTLVADTDGDGVAEFVETTAGVLVSLIGGFMSDGFGNAGAIANIENVDGTEFDDFIIGDNNANVLNGLGGADLIQGRGGDDTIRGGEGDDHLAGESTSSSYNGPFGNDALFGEGGDDLLRGGAGVDSFDGGVGFDRVSFFTRAATQGAVANLITQTIANDGFGNAETMVSIEALGAGTAFADHLTGDNNDNFLLAEMGDTIIANGGNDSFQLGGAPALLHGGAGVDTITGFFGSAGSLFPDSDGDGLAEIVLATSGVHVDLSAGLILNDGFGLSGTIISVENVTGSVFADLLIGNNVANTLVGDEGDDTLNGGGGADTLDGAAGVDTLNGGSGADTLIGGEGDDAMNGGAQSDTFVFASGSGHDTITGFDANPAGGQDFLDISAFGITATDFAARVAVADLGPHLQVTIDGADVITLLGVSGNGPNVITQTDFILSGP